MPNYSYLSLYSCSVSGAESARLVMAEANKAKRPPARPSQPTGTINFNPSQAPSRDNTYGNVIAKRGFVLGADNDLSLRRK